MWVIVIQSCPTLCEDPVDRLLCPRDFPGENTGVSCHSLLQGIFPSLGIEPGSPALQADSLPVELPGSPYSCLSEWVKVAQSCQTLCNPMDYTLHEILQARILEWVAFPFSRGSSQPRDQTRVSCITGGFFTNWSTYRYIHVFKLIDLTLRIYAFDC